MGAEVGSQRNQPGPQPLAVNRKSRPLRARLRKWESRRGEAATGFELQSKENTPKGTTNSSPSTEGLQPGWASILSLPDSSLCLRKLRQHSRSQSNFLRSPLPEECTLSSFGATESAGVGKLFGKVAMSHMDAVPRRDLSSLSWKGCLLCWLP